MASGSAVLRADVDGMVGAVREVGLLERAACRRAEQRFSVRRMALKHVARYERLCAGPQ